MPRSTELSEALIKQLLAALNDAIQDPDREVRLRALGTIGNLGAPAEGMVPALRTMIRSDDDGDLEMSRLTARALLLIDPRLSFLRLAAPSAGSKASAGSGTT